MATPMVFSKFNKKPVQSVKAEVPVVRNVAYTSSTGQESVDFRQVKEIPTKDELLFWWECFRKHSYETVEEAHEAIIEKTHGDLTEIAPYKCHYCSNFHNGHLSADASVKRTKSQPSDIRAQWRKRIVKPTVEEVSYAFEHPKERTLTYWRDLPNK